MKEATVYKQVSLADYIEAAVAHAHLEAEQEGSETSGYTATVPEMAGCISFGRTETEAIDNLRDAIENWVLTAIRFGDPVPVIAGVQLRYTSKSYPSA